MTTLFWRYLRGGTVANRLNFAKSDVALETGVRGLVTKNSIAAQTEIPPFSVIA